MRPATYPKLCGALGAQWAVLVTTFAQTDPAAPSRVPGWTVADLERHVSQTGQSLGALADGPPADGLVTGLREWADALPGISDRIAERVRNDPAPPLADMAPSTLAALNVADPSMPVAQLTGTHLLIDATLFRLIEAVVHGLDLPDPPAPDPTARTLVVRALADLLAQRAPGRSVELRIPPVMAVQLIEGPRHTRGTPPGVVETDPTTFLRLATGRELWAAAAAQGQLRASGERTDLSPYLPLLS